MKSNEQIMPRQNRVTPFGAIVATPERGTLMGNRGCLHDGQGHIVRQFQRQSWVICLLSFKSRKRPIMQPGHYTELFFLDEATAMAAGHRPCARCQRGRFNLFQEFWAKANSETTSSRKPTATLIDAALHSERTSGNTQARRYCNSLESLPDGTFITNDERNAYVILKNQLFKWSPAGYENTEGRDFKFPARVLTPASIVRTLSVGYPVGIHSSATKPA